MTATAKKKQPDPANQQKPALPIQSGVNKRPFRGLIYGPEGVGKSQLVADFGAVAFLDCEDGTSHLDVDRLVFDDTGRTKPVNLGEVHGALRAFGQSEHSFTAVAIDGLDALEKLIFQDIVTKAKKENIESFGYGRGYVLAVDEWRRLAELVEWLGRRGLAVIFVGHSELHTYQNPEGDDFDQFGPMVHKRAANFLRGWLDHLWFMTFEDVTRPAAKKGGDEKTVGEYTGVRVLHFQRGAAWHGKTRGPHPESVVIPKESPWSAVRDALTQAAKENAR